MKTLQKILAFGILALVCSAGVTAQVNNAPLVAAQQAVTATAAASSR